MVLFKPSRIVAIVDK